LVTGSEDGNVLVYILPADGINADISESTSQLECGGKLSFLKLHPFVPDVLVTTSTNFDGTFIQYWHLQKKEMKFNVNLFKEAIYDLSFHPSNLNVVAVSSKDTKTRVVDVRAGKVLLEIEPLEGLRDTQVIWVNDHLLLTLGFGKMGKRSISLWDTNDNGKCLKTLDASLSTSQLLPYYDEDTHILFTANNGGSTMCSYNVSPTSPYIEQLNDWMSTSDFIGMFFFPKLSCDVRKAEIAKFLKLTKETVVPISWTVPRKRLEYFQDDIFFPTRSPEPVQSADDFFAGDGKMEMEYVSMKPSNMTELSKAPKEELTEREKRYQQRLIEEEKAKQEKPRGATGHQTATEVRQHFQQIAQTLPSKNRWDATQDNSQVDVDADEWN